MMVGDDKDPDWFSRWVKEEGENEIINMLLEEEEEEEEEKEEEKEEVKKEVKEQGEKEIIDMLLLVDHTLIDEFFFHKHLEQLRNSFLPLDVDECQPKSDLGVGGLHFFWSCERKLAKQRLVTANCQNYQEKSFHFFSSQSFLFAHQFSTDTSVILRSSTCLLVKFIDVLHLM